MNASTLLRTSFAALAMVAAGVSESSAQQPQFTGYGSVVHPTATASAFAPRCTIPSYAAVAPIVGTPTWPVTGAVSGWTPAVAPRPMLLIDPHLSSYETWAQYDSVRDADRWRNDGIRHRQHDHALNQFGYRDGVNFR